MKLKNKILLIVFLILMFILFLNTSNVFASFNFTYNDTKYTVPDIPTDYPYYLIIDKGSGVFRLFMCENEMIFKTATLANGSKVISLHSTVSGGTIYQYTNLAGDNVTISDSYRSLGTGTSLGIDYNTVSIVYSNHDLYHGEELVFQSPVTEVPGVQIPALETAEEVPQAMTQTLKILIPVGLIVLSVGLVIYLIKRVIYISQ